MLQEPKNAEVKVLRERLVVLNETDQALAEIFKFNQELMMMPLKKMAT